MPASRRLVRAGLVTLAAWLLLGGAIGVASADDAPSTSFVMPAVLLGDRVSYDQVREEDGTTERTTRSLAWDRREPMLLRDGQWHDVDSLRQDLGDMADADPSGLFDVLLAAGTLEYEAGTHEVLALTVGLDGSGSGDAQFVGPIPVQSTTMEAGIEMSIFLPVFAELGAMPDCLFGGVWAGQEVRSDGELKFPPCTSGAPLLSGMTLHGKGQEDVDGVPALRFHGRQGLGQGLFGQSSWTELDLWLSPASPYPLRAEATSLLRGERESLTLDMTGFQAGTQARTTAAPWPADPQPELRLARFDGLLPFDDADTGIPFPLSRAIAAARMDTRVEEYLAEHPRAYVVAAASGETVTAGQPQRAWSFVLADSSSEGLQVDVVQEQPGGDAIPSPLAPALRLDHVLDVQTTDGNAPSRTELPAELPTMGSLLERWAWQRDVANDGQSVVYDLRTGDLSMDEVFAGGQVVIVGRLTSTIDPTIGPGGVAMTESGTIDWAAYDMAGELALLLGLRGNETTVYGPGGPAPVGSGGGVAPLTTSVAAGGWMPTAAQAAGAGLVAVLLGAVYWLWPKIKLLAFAGLFSRLAPSQLLDHPGRARLLEIIQAEPGIHFQELVRRSGLATGTAVHHLNKLARGSLIACRPLGRYTCYFPGSSPDRQSLLAAPLLRSEGARQVYEAILATPDLSGLELADRTGLQKSTVNYHVQRLTEAGLVTARRDGRSVRLTAAWQAAGTAPMAWQPA